MGLPKVVAESKKLNNTSNAIPFVIRESFLKYPKKYRKDFSNLNKQNVYMLLFTHQNEKYCLLIQGDDKHLEALKRRLVFKGGLR